MRREPPFFREIAALSADLWENLEAKPEIAAPWWQLFRQVDSPRHVLSELLQNAEDAKATWARCAIINSEFIFEHNGLDFDPDTLGSLCRFGYSNKRSLHTIGFRGIGFKTTFSLGPVVTVETPTLAFQFSQQRFTLPIWVQNAEPLPHTRIRVSIEDHNRLAALSENMAEWLQSPVPLLFFTYLQSLEINGVRVDKEPIGPGPVKGSEWLLLKSDKPLRLLKITDDAEEMPADAVEEIRRERGDSDFHPAGCSLDLIFGLSENKVYTILPTQVIPQLPFSCNAPFVQEPSRVRISDPAQSPTNRWLLERAGKLAAQTMLSWLSNTEISAEERINSYQLLPSIDTSSITALDSAVRSIILHEMKEQLTPSGCLIAQNTFLSHSSTCADIPRDFVEAWGAKTAIGLLGEGKESCIHVSVDDNIRRNLADWGLLQASDDGVLKAILEEAQTLPRPETNEGLIQLWSAAEELLTKSVYWWKRESCVFPIVPIVGSGHLYRPKDICRSVAPSEALSRDDHAFLCQIIKIADGSFIEFLEASTTEQTATEDTGSAARERLERARSLLIRCGLENWFLPRVFQAACGVTFSTKSTREHRIRLTQIAIKADLSASDGGLKYLCKDGTLKLPERGLIYSNGLYDDLLPEDWVDKFCISEEYDQLLPEEEGAVKRWLNSARSGVTAFPVPRLTTSKILSHNLVDFVSSQRGGTTPDFWRAATKHEFDFTDYDWGTELVLHWKNLAETETDTWARVVEACAHSWSQQVPMRAKAKIDRPKGAARYMVSEGLTAAWLHRLQSLPCLRDDKWNRPELPYNLLFRTSETEPLINIEKFVHRTMDTTQTRTLLELLGVRSQPRNAEILIERLLALAETNQPPPNPRSRSVPRFGWCF